MKKEYMHIKFFNTKNIAIGTSPRSQVSLANQFTVAQTNTPLSYKLDIIYQQLHNELSGSFEKQEVENRVKLGLFFYALCAVGAEPAVNFIKENGDKNNAAFLITSAAPIFLKTSEAKIVSMLCGFSTDQNILNQIQNAEVTDLLEVLSNIEGISLKQPKTNYVLPKLKSNRIADYSYSNKYSLEAKLARESQATNEKIVHTNKVANAELEKMHLAIKKGALETMRLEKINLLLSMIQRIMLRYAKNGASPDVVKMIQELPKALQRIMEIVLAIGRVGYDLDKVLDSLKRLRLNVSEVVV